MFFKLQTPVKRHSFQFTGEERELWELSLAANNGIQHSFLHEPKRRRLPTSSSVNTAFTAHNQQQVKERRAAVENIENESRDRSCESNGSFSGTSRGVVRSATTGGHFNVKAAASAARNRKTMSAQTSCNSATTADEIQRPTVVLLTDFDGEPHELYNNDGADSQVANSRNELRQKPPGIRRTSFAEPNVILNGDLGSIGGGISAAARRRRSSVAREKWASKVEFLLAVIGYAVDLGNIWRFPSICYKYGGGAFLIPYLVMLCIGGLPMFYMELILGQFHRSGCLSIWKRICPMFKGIGYGICFVCTFIACFYNAIIAHAVYFFIQSLAWDVPWRHCGNEWNTDLCREDVGNSSLTNSTALTTEYRTPSQEYYMQVNGNQLHKTYKVLELNKSTGFDDLGGIKPEMAFCLFLVFLAVYFALWKGPRSSGKVVWVTATAPYIVLTILLIRGLTLPGAGKGIKYYLTPDFNKLLQPGKKKEYQQEFLLLDVWTAAATQIFFSLGPGFGVLLALSSYNDFNNNCYRDALVTSLINCFTSFFSGFVIFSTLGYMSVLTNKPVSEVVGESESSLIFVVYPQAIATMSYSSLWSAIFFLMLITLGIDSTFSGIEALITGFCDEYPRVLARKREIFVAFVIIFYYFGSLPTVTYGGTYVIPFLDAYGVSLSVLFIVMCEMIAVCWFYGINRFSEDIRLMLGFYPGIYWRICWFSCPFFIGLIFALALYETSFSPLEIPNYTYPEWSVWLGWILRLLSCLSVPFYMIYLFLTTRGTPLQRLRFMIKPQQRHASTTNSTCPSIAILEDKSGAMNTESSHPTYRSAVRRPSSNCSIAHV
ncbi:Sodium-dependent serotonin transporter [Aphelenchoides besseyi]|nr:Sodium-dependent serotonin transporter [Aphelenchoides besseyi]